VSHWGIQDRGHVQVTLPAVDDFQGWITTTTQFGHRLQQNLGSSSLDTQAEKFYFRSHSSAAVARRTRLLFITSTRIRSSFPQIDGCIQHFNEDSASWFSTSRMDTSGNSCRIDEPRRNGSME
jgi:hypothetical protein